MRTICAEDSRISSCVRFPAVSMAKIAEKYEPDRRKVRGENSGFPRACVCRRTCQLICASVARETCMDAWTAWILFVWQEAVCVSAAQAPHAGRGYGKKNRKHKRKDLTHTVYKMYNKDSRT